MERKHADTTQTTFSDDSHTADSADDQLPESERFERFVNRIPGLEDEQNCFEHQGTGNFLQYKLGHLKGSVFETTPRDPAGLFREVRDERTNTSILLTPAVCERPCLLRESQLVKENGKPVNITYKDEFQGPETPTSESYPFPPDVLDKGHPDHFTVSKSDMLKAFRSIREEVTRKLVSPITRATGYKWVYTRSLYKIHGYFLFFSCYQDCKKDMVPSKLKHKHVMSVFDPQECKSNICIGINIYTKNFVLQYTHEPHTKLLDIIYTLLLEMYNLQVDYSDVYPAVEGNHDTPTVLPPLETTRSKHAHTHTCTEAHKHSHTHTHTMPT